MSVQQKKPAKEEKKQGQAMEDVEGDARIKPLARKIQPSVRVKRALAASEKSLKDAITKNGADKYLKYITDSFKNEGYATSSEESKRIEKVLKAAVTSGKYATNIDAGVFKTSIGGYDADGQAAIAKAIKILALYSPNITKYATVSKGGSQFRTIRVPKTLINLPKPPTLRSNVLLLVQISNALWNGMFKGLRPLGVFTKAMLAWFRDQSPTNIPVSSTLSNDDVTAILNSVKTNHPNLLAYYLYYKASKAIYNDTMTKLKLEADQLREKYNDVIRMGVSSPEKIQMLIGSVIGVYDSITDMPKPSDESVKAFLTNKLSTGSTRRVAPKNYRYLISTQKKTYNYAETPVVAGLESREAMKKTVALPRMTDEMKELMWPKGQRRGISQEEAKKRAIAQAMSRGLEEEEAKKMIEEEEELGEGEMPGEYEYEPEAA